MIRNKLEIEEIVALVGMVILTAVTITILIIGTKKCIEHDRPIAVAAYKEMEQW